MLTDLCLLKITDKSALEVKTRNAKIDTTPKTQIVYN